MKIHMFDQHNETTKSNSIKNQGGLVRGKSTVPTPTTIPFYVVLPNGWDILEYHHNHGSSMAIRYPALIDIPTL